MLRPCRAGRGLPGKHFSRPRMETPAVRPGGASSISTGSRTQSSVLGHLSTGLCWVYRSSWDVKKLEGAPRARAGLLGSSWQPVKAHGGSHPEGPALKGVRRESWGTEDQTSSSSGMESSMARGFHTGLREVMLLPLELIPTGVHQPAFGLHSWHGAPMGGDALRALAPPLQAAQCACAGSSTPSSLASNG